MRVQAAKVWAPMVVVRLTASGRDSTPAGRRSSGPWSPTYLRLGLVEQRGPVAVAAVKKVDLDGRVTLSLLAQPTLRVSELPGDQWVGVARRLSGAF